MVAIRFASVPSGPPPVRSGTGYSFVRSADIEAPMLGRTSRRTERQRPVPDKETPPFIHSSLGAARRAVSWWTTRAGSDHSPLAREGMVETGHNDDSWQKPIGANRRPHLSSSGCWKRLPSYPKRPKPSGGRADMMRSMPGGTAFSKSNHLSPGGRRILPGALFMEIKSGGLMCMHRRRIAALPARSAFQRRFYRPT
jgi:hypothetical protein